MAKIVLLTWDDWEAVFIDGEKVASGHRGRVNQLEAVEGCLVEQVKESRVFPEGGGYADTLDGVENYDE